jgi:MFS family permease
MDCRDIVEILGAGRELTAAAREHVSSCARCRALVDATAFPAEEPSLSPEVQEKLARIAAKDPAPVRPLVLSWYSLLFLACAVLAALIGVLGLGSRGWRLSTPLQQSWLIPGLLAMAVTVPAILARLMVPGALLRIRPTRLLLVTVCWFALAAPLVYPVHMYPAFGRSAIACLLMGLGFASAVAIAAWLILQRGFVTAPGIAAITAGGLAGTSSLALQFIYCSHLDTGHFALAHLGSFLLSIVLGGLLLRARSSHS